MAFNRPLLRALLAVGRWSALPSGVNALGAALMCLGFIAVTLAAVAGLLAGTYQEHRTEVSQLRAPVVADQPALHWLSLSSGVDDYIVEVIALQPVDEAAPLPPGVERWPRPGEAVLSPALAGLLSQRGVPDRYGTPVGLIGREGLVSRTELLAYTRPGISIIDQPRTLAVAYFGARSAEEARPIGEVLYDRDFREFWLICALLLGLPGVMAVASGATTIGAKAREVNLTLLRFGAGPYARFVVALPRVVVPAGVAVLVSVLVILLASAVDLRVPFTSFVIEAALVRSRAVLLMAVAATTICAAAALAAALATIVSGRVRYGRFLYQAERPAWVRTALLAATLAFQPWAVVLSSHDPDMTLAVLVGSASMVVVFLPAALATLLRVIGPWMATRQLSRGRVGAFLGWRLHAHQSRGPARLAASVAGLVVLTSCAAALVAALSEQAQGARAAADRLGTSMLAVDSRFTSSDEVVAFARKHALGAVRVDRTLSMLEQHAHDKVTVTGECRDLAKLGLTCLDGPPRSERRSFQLDALIGQYEEPANVTVRVASPAAFDTDGVPGHLGAHAMGTDDSQIRLSSIYFLAPDGGQPDSLLLARHAHHSGLLIEIDRLGTEWIRGAADLRQKSSWLFSFGVPGVLVLLLVGACVQAAEVLNETRSLLRNPLVAWTNVLDTVAAIRIGVPIVAGGLIGVGASTWILAAIARHGSVSLRFDFFGIVAVMSVVVAGLSYRGASHALRKATRRDPTPWPQPMSSARL